MSDNAETRRFECESRNNESPRVTKRKSWWESNLSMLLLVVVSLISIFTLLVITVRVKRERERLANPGVLTARYIDEAKSITNLKDNIIRPMPMLNRVIFRLDGVEIFRFTYEAGREHNIFGLS